MMSPSDTKPTALPSAFTSGAAEMCLSTSSFMASATVAFDGRVNTSRFMMDSSTVRRALSLSSSAVSPGLFFTSATTMTKPMRHSTPARANATSMPKMLACVGVITRALAFVAMVDAETMMAVPSEPATWRNVLFTEVPWFTSSLSSAFMPQVVMGMFTSDSENRRTVYRRVKVMMPVRCSGMRSRT